LPGPPCPPPSGRRWKRRFILPAQSPDGRPGRPRGRLEQIGARRCGFQANSSVELLGGTDADAKDTPSADWGKTLDQFYAGKFSAILDGFAVDNADLSAGHNTQLDGVVTRMKADATLKAQLGGASDLTEQHGEALSLKRAENARDYLVRNGIDAGRIEVQSYGSDWARVEAQRTVAEGKNRRVQIWVHK
jgi:outer membrane protein OmpA-like peptidoglycan-associated protein